MYKSKDMIIGPINIGTVTSIDHQRTVKLPADINPNVGTELSYVLIQWMAPSP